MLDARWEIPSGWKCEEDTTVVEPSAKEEDEEEWE
jgi:hypothetical protein